MINASNEMTVGVVIPFYNGSAFIERALISVFEQSTKANEVLVVNDGSIEEEKQFLHNLRDRYPGKFEILDQENQGQGGARNTGVVNLKSRYVCFLDQDDRFLKNHISILLNVVKSQNQDFGFVYGDLRVLDSKNRVLYNNFISNRAIHPKKNITDLLGQDMYILPSASIINVEKFLLIGGFDSQFKGYEDDDLFLRMFIAGFDHYFVSENVTDWYINLSSTTFSINMKRSRYKYFCKLVNEFPDAEEIGAYYLDSCIARRFSKHFIYDFLRELRCPTPYFDEIKSFLVGFRDIVISNNNRINLIYKIKIIFIVFMLNMIAKISWFLRRKNL